MSVRKLKKSYQNVTGRFYSTLLNRLVQFDSLLERDFILLLDMHPAVQWFAEQPMKIRYEDDKNIEQIYVPDFLVKFGSNRFLGKAARLPWIVETKYRCELKSSWPQLRPKLRAGFREARKRNSQFHIVSESCLSEVPFANARFLRRFSNVDLEPDSLAEMVYAVRNAGPTTVAALSRQQNPQVMQILWSAIAKRIITAEFDEPLGPQTTIWVR